MSLFLLHYVAKLICDSADYILITLVSYRPHCTTEIYDLIYHQCPGTILCMRSANKSRRLSLAGSIHKITLQCSNMRLNSGFDLTFGKSLFISDSYLTVHLHVHGHTWTTWGWDSGCSHSIAPTGSACELVIKSTFIIKSLRWNALLIMYLCALYLCNWPVYA